MNAYSCTRECLQRPPLTFIFHEQARITTKYTPNPPIKRRRLNRSPRKRTDYDDESTKADTGGKSSDGTTASSATLTLKTFDPVSGVCLKYCTRKQQEVGRLIGAGGLATIAHVMAGSEKSEAAVESIKTEPVQEELANAVNDAEEKEIKVEEKPPVHMRKKSVSFSPNVEVHKAPPQQGGGGGGGKKKKKGKGR